MMRIEKSHEFKKDQAKKRMKELCEYWQNKYGITPSWKKDQVSVAGNIMGFSFDALLTVEGNQVVCEGPPPNLLVRKQVIHYIEQKIEEYLDPDVDLKDLKVKSKDV